MNEFRRNTLNCNDERKIIQMKDYLINMYYGMKVTACTHVLTDTDMENVFNFTARTSVMNSYEYRCLHCLHPVNCFIRKIRPLFNLEKNHGVLFNEKQTEYETFEKWVDVELRPSSDESDDQTMNSETGSFVVDPDDLQIKEKVYMLIDDTAKRLLNTAQIGREKLEQRPFETINDIFHAVLSQHIATAHVNDACRNIATLWRSLPEVGDNQQNASIYCLKSMRQACWTTIRIVATYGWSIFSYSHLVCHLVCVELASMLSSRTTIC